jgi:LmbE family N-acetylglucosaminyl deacetylase
MPKEKILIFCAHDDDHVIGMGGTIAKYAKEGKEIYAVISSYGEKSHPWLKKLVTIKMRVKESKRAAKLLGIKETKYLALRDTHVKEDIKTKKINKIIERMITKLKPSKIFTLTPDDPHKDHRAICEAVLDAAKKTKFKGDIYGFEVWNPVNIKKRNEPVMVVDISEYYKKKQQAMDIFKSQKITMVQMGPISRFKALFRGLSHDVTYAERFRKLR